MEISQSDLLQICMMGTEEEWNKFIATGVDIKQFRFTELCEGDTPLHIAVKFHTNHNLIRPMVNAGIDINILNTEGETPLHSAVIFNNNPQIIKELVALGSNINAHSIEVPTPLIYAIILNKISFVQELLTLGANVDEKDAQGAPPLVFAFQLRNCHTIPILLKFGANLNQLIDEETPVWSTLFEVDNSVDMISMIITYGFDVNVQNIHGFTPLHYAVSTNETSENILFLLDHGADPLVKTNNGISAWDLIQSNDTLKYTKAYTILSHFAC